MKPIYFKRISDGKEFRVVRIKPSGIKGVSADGEVVYKQGKGYSKLYSK